MKKLLFIIIAISLVVIGFFQYKSYTKFSPPTDYDYAVNDSIDINYFDILLVDQYYKNCYAIGSYARSQWYQHKIDVLFPDNTEEAQTAATHYNNLKAVTHQIEDQLIYSKTLKERGLTNSDINQIVTKGTSLEDIKIYNYSHLLNLSIGTTSDQVQELQTLMYEMGYVLPVDGTFGVETENAVKKIQAEHKLYPSGRVDKRTLHLLIK